jgi:hypothetical protein
MKSSVNTDAKRKRAGLALRSARCWALNPYAFDPETGEVAVRPPAANAPSSRTIIEMPTVTNTTAKTAKYAAIVRTRLGQATRWGEPARWGGSGSADRSIASHRRTEGRDARSDPDTNPRSPYPSQVAQSRAATHEVRERNPRPRRGARPRCLGRPISPDERPVRRRAFRSWSSPVSVRLAMSARPFWVEPRGLLDRRVH